MQDTAMHASKMILYLQNKPSVQRFVFIIMSQKSNYNVHVHKGRTTHELINKNIPCANTQSRYEMMIHTVAKTEE